MSDVLTVPVRTATRGPVPEDAAAEAAERVGAVLRGAPEPVLFARVKLIMSADPAAPRPAIAQVNVDLNGRVVRTEAAGLMMRTAVEQACERLKARLERLARDWESRRGGRPAPGEWRHQSPRAPRLPYFPRPAGERAVMRRKSYSLGRLTADQAAGEAALLDYDFHLFTEASTGQDSVIYRVAEGWRLALAQPAASLSAPADPSVSVSKMPAPRLSVAEAVTRLEAVGQSFLFFVDAQAGRGNLIYHRYDGHYGLITPAGDRP